MDFFNRLFRNRISQKDQPEIQFGRYSDANKPKDRYDAWDESLELFEKTEYGQSFRKFFYYLMNEKEDNVVFESHDDGMTFTIYQGSKHISGFVNKEEVKAEAKIARTKALNIGFLRRMMEQNFSLKYSRYALDEEDNITIVFDSLLLDGSPYKLYFALKEVAVNADKLDDILVNEFEVLEEINTSHTEDLPPAEKEVKTRFLKKWIDEAMEYIESGKLDRVKYPGGIAYVLLDLMYKIDYLIVPEGPTMEVLERMHRQYFTNNKMSLLKKVQQLMKGMESIRNTPADQLANELYLITSTFGLTSPVEHNQVKSFIEGELKNMPWYIENDYPVPAMAIPGYIVGFGLFNYALPLPVKFLYRLYYQIMEDEYFRELGFNFSFINKDGSISRRAVKREVERLLDGWKDAFPRMKPHTSGLDFTDRLSFAQSYLMMIFNLDLSPPDQS